MNLLLVLLIAVAALFFINEGLLFLGFLAIIILVLAVVAGGGKQAASPYGERGEGGPDVILEQEEPDIPSNIDIKVKPNWEANTLFEDMFAADGEMVDVIGRSLASFATGGKYGKPKGHTEDEPEFGG